MKNLFRKIVLFLLTRFAKRRLKKYKGKIIAVTGSIGKTSTKEAIYTVLNSQFKTKKSKRSMNSEFGLILTILDIDSGYRSFTKWSWLLMKAFFHSLFQDHSEVLLLECGVDKPGDMDFLTSVIKPDIVVFTSVSPVHVDEGQFKTLKDIFEEKKKLVDNLKEQGIAILNKDNEFLADFAKKRPKKTTLTYGADKEADYYFSNVESRVEGTSFILHTEGGTDHKKYEVQTNVLGEYQPYVMLPAVVCGHLMGMEMENIVLALSRYTLPPGRMNMIPGIEETQILDSSYNSSPEALKEALKVLKKIGGEHRKVAVLGNMNELGEQSAILHKMIGEFVPGHADLLLTVGTSAKLFGEGAEEKGMDPKKIHSFKNVKEAVEFFKKEIKKNDLILAKGSQNNVRLERFVKEFMLHPEDADKLLVRQDKYWKKKL